MTTARRAAFALAAFLVLALPAAAQAPPQVSLTPPGAPRWDAAGFAGWFGGNKEDVGEEWDDWYAGASAGITAGYYWTTHLKTDISLATTSEGRVYTAELIPIPGEPYPFYRPREHYFRLTTLSAGVAYQFGENTWFHPFVGAGVDVSRERERVEVPGQNVPTRGGRPLVIPGFEPRTSTSLTARPFVAGGFKWYVAERVFVRSELRAALSDIGAETIDWRSGIGFDF